MSEYRINSADISIRCDATVDDLIDVLEAKSRSYIPVIYALNKIDAISIEELDLLHRIPDACPISSEHGWNVDELLALMWEKLDLARVYTKPKGRLPDYSAPVVLRSTACTVEDFVRHPHLNEGHLPLSRARFDPYWSRTRRLTFRGVAAPQPLAVQLHPQAHSRAVQARHCVRQVGQAPAAAGGSDPRAGRRRHQ
jgi:hypothetical protein